MSLVQKLRFLTADRVTESNRSPMLERINDTRYNDTIAWGCGIVFAVLTILFLI